MWLGVLELADSEDDVPVVEHGFSFWGRCFVSLLPVLVLEIRECCLWVLSGSGLLLFVVPKWTLLPVLGGETP